ncbi:trypsin-like peptidase domain-containing protein [Nocardia sp. NEAU-351]|uniref:Trypsin-like peptidase domain-containing protein n=2 Tax=Nocardia bovistercoris TaxID=2785916 RepID=A0A931N0L6_9NOCA|nr:trypsin-like peptidase domain-containing protein [Nocardia bovistercoris]MBH0774802.1 trypsin-like peptidase domain-containing protein [Nocardia bovistercoris]
MVVNVDDAAMDDFSRTVIGVSETVSPRVALVRTRSSGGSAVVCADDGDLLTNAHVVGADDGGTVTFADGTESRFEVVGVDPLSDLAVLRARGGSPGAVALGDAETLVVGQLVVAVGSPLGLAGSVTAGVVSALGHAVPVSSRRAGRVIEDVIQTDAASVPGHSGGALCDSRARVVGINTAVAGFGLGLAIPINSTTRRIIDALRADGAIRRAYLGLVCVPAPLSAAVAARVGRTGGVRVIDVVRGSPAETAGLRRGDLVIAFGDADVHDARAVQRGLFAEAIDRPLTVAVLRRDVVVDIVAVPIELVPH